MEKKRGLRLHSNKSEVKKAMRKKPIIGITMGDPFGNGPEITVQALAEITLYQEANFVVIGDAKCIEYAVRVAEQRSGTLLTVRTLQNIDDAIFTPGIVNVLDLDLVASKYIPKLTDDPQPFGVGACSAGGEASFRYVEKAIEFALAGTLDATVTNALSKEAINLAGHHFSGHTEIYAHYTKTSDYAMMLAHEALRVVHVSTHVSLLEACECVKKDRVLTCIRLANSACKALGIAQPKIAVAGLNPHCGEGGLFGKEEINEIQPAIDAALAEGICIPDKKPSPPDTVFSKALGGWYDIIVVMYHDQGHIPLKVKGFVYEPTQKAWDAVAGVNITLGLPVIRTSVDHGTGFGHAGNGNANALSLLNAIDYAVRMAKCRQT